MIRVGLTGGIGSGKSTVAEFFRALGIPVYSADSRAKKLMETRPDLVRDIQALLGPQAYDDQKLDRGYIASRVFDSPELLSRLNSLVHPEVRRDFEDWARAQRSPYVIQEAAILFENGSDQKFDRMVLVTAPEEIRLQRVMERDGSTREAVLKRMENQWPDSKKIPRADFVIENIDLDAARARTEAVHRKLLEISDAAE